MKLIKLFICLIIIFFSTTVSAEFYKYVDENGNTHFTDDINKVPVDQRKGLKGYKEPERESIDDTTEKNTVEEKKETKPTDDDESLEKFHERLNNSRLELVKENEEIKKEREQITEDGKNAKTNAAVSKTNKRVKNLNKRQEEYNKKYETYEIERKEYMEKLEEAEAKENEEK